MNEDQGQTVYRNQLPEKFEMAVGLAIASFVLAILAIPLSFSIFVGAIAAVIALIIAIVGLSKTNYLKGTFITAIVLSIIALIISGGVAYFYYNSIAPLLNDGGLEFTKNEKIGLYTPDMNLTTIDGEQIKLSELEGRKVVLAFWATWCPPCKKEIPHFNEIAKNADPNELLVIGISSEKESALKSFAQQTEINYPIVSKDDLPVPYDTITSIPTTVFLDEEGIIRSWISGYHDLESLKAEIAKLDKPKQQPAQGQQAADEPNGM